MNSFWIEQTIGLLIFGGIMWAAVHFGWAETALLAAIRALT